MCAFVRRCDCKEQLNMALRYIQKHGGAIIYLQQEGRGIGLANKVAAYGLPWNTQSRASNAPRQRRQFVRLDEAVTRFTPNR